jgi:hypothetical protein
MGFAIGLILGIVITAALAVALIRYGLPIAILNGWIR